MKKHLILFFIGVILSYGNIKAQTVPDKKEILKITLQVNDYFMKKYADYRTPSFVKKWFVLVISGHGVCITRV